MQHSLLIGLWNLYNFPYDNPLSPYTILNQVMADTEALILFIKKIQRCPAHNTCRLVALIGPLKYELLDITRYEMLLDITSIMTKEKHLTSI
jgi:hypothetical protein